MHSLYFIKNKEAMFFRSFHQFPHIDAFSKEQFLHLLQCFSLFAVIYTYIYIYIPSFIEIFRGFALVFSESSAASLGKG